MLPIFSAAGHLPYAKASRLYVCQFESLKTRFDPQDVDKIMAKSVIRRTDKFWGGVSPDLACEQDVMRPFKISGGMVRGRGITPETLATWIWAMPRCAPMCEALESYCGVRSESTEQHVEMRESRQARDKRDLLKIVEWFDAHPPFGERPPQELISLSTGVVADTSVNCDRAFEIGLQSLNSVSGETFSGLKLKRKDKVKTFSSMARSVTVGQKQVEINPELFFHRIIFICLTEEDKRNAFFFELSPQPSSLFEAGLMRKTAKSALADILAQRCPCDTACPKDTIFVIDGGYLLHLLSNWQMNNTFAEICSQYVALVVHRYGKSSHVVFDGYRGPATTKGQEQARRAALKSSVIVKVRPNLPVTVAATPFLANAENKSQFIDLLKDAFCASGINVYQAVGDADVLIVETALRLSAHKKPVTIVATDTDILVIALARSVKNKHALHILSPGGAVQVAKVHNIGKLQDSLEKYTLDHLPFIHAMTGCDTTSALYGKGKKSSLELLKSSTSLRSKLSVFRKRGSSKEAIAAAGEKFIMELYSNRSLSGKFHSLNELRFACYTNTISNQKLSSSFNLASLPPTSDAARQHAFRVYYQVQQWLGNNLEPTDWGWVKTAQATLAPIPMESLPAPENLMHLISCKCKETCGPRCICRKNNMECTIMCKHCQGVECTNCKQRLETESDSECIDDPGGLAV